MAEESNQIQKVDSVLKFNKNEKPESVQMAHSPTYCNEDKDMSSDELVIDLGQDDKGKCSIAKKRKRTSTSESSEEALNLPQHCLEIEKKVSAAAAKNNLTSENVKNILKKVILNEHVLAVVKLREEEVQKKIETFEIPKLKLTRAKTRELKKSSNSAVQWPLPITPVKVPLEPVLPEVKTLISEDLLDEESDDEYQPTQEEHSDEERDNLELSFDNDSLPQTPENLKPETTEEPVDEQIPQDSIEIPIKYTEDGLFKIPKEIEKKINAEEEATIALRTRSKLCLSDTPIEKIEESFIPPDIGFDDTFEVDYIWRDFIQELPNPELVHNEDDDDADPEYNFAADFEPFDREELREDDEVEVSNKELNDLMAELFDGIDTNFDMDTPILNSNNDLISSLLETDNVNLNLNPIPIKIINPEKKVCVEENNVSNFENCTNEDQIFKYEVQIVDKKESYPLNYTISFKYPDIAPGKEMNIPSPVPEQVISVDNSNRLEHYEKEKDTNSQDCETVYGIKPIQHRKLSKYPLFTMPTDYRNWGEENVEVRFLPNQRLLLEQQMRQHVQLLTQNYLQFYKHPVFNELANEQKEFLVSLKYLGDDKTESAFRPCNLLPAIQLCNTWTQKLDEDTPEIKEMLSHVSTEMVKMGIKRIKYTKHYGRFPQLFISLIMESSNVFLYPEFLPDIPYRNDGYERKEYLKSEDQLIAMGLEQFYQYLYLNERIVLTPDNLQLYKVTDLLNKYLLPSILPNILKSRIKRMKWRKDNNPISIFYTSGKAPETENEILPYKLDLCVKDHPKTQFSGIWQKILKSYNSKKTTHNKIWEKIQEPAQSIVDCIDVENTPSLSTVPTKTVSSTMTPLLSTRAVKSPQKPNATSVSFIKRSSPNLIAKLIESSVKSGCECLKILHDDVNSLSSKDQPLITDFFPTKHTKKVKENNINEERKRQNVKASKKFLQPKEPKIKFKLLVLLSLSWPCKGNVSSVKDLESVGNDSSNGIKEKFLQRVIYSSEMLISTTFFPRESASSSGFSQNTNNLHKTLAFNENELLANDENGVSKKVYSNNYHSDEIKDKKRAIEFFDKVKARLRSDKRNSIAFTKFDSFKSILKSFDYQNESPCKLYNRLAAFFGDENANLTEDFLTFLTPSQATEIGRFVDYFMLICMTDFVEILQIYLANEPLQLCKILCCLESLAEMPKIELSVDFMKNSVLPLLMEDHYLIDCFLKIFPGEISPDSQGVFNLEESNTSDKMLSMPNFDDNFGGRTCKCACHNLMDEQFKSHSKHCLACGNKYIQGRNFVHYGSSSRTIFLNWNSNSENVKTQVPSSSSSNQRNLRKRIASIDLQNPTSFSEPNSDDERVSTKKNAKRTKTPIKKRKRLTPSKKISKNNKNIQIEDKASDNSHKNEDSTLSLHNCNENEEFDIVDEFADFKRKFRENELVAETSSTDVASENDKIHVENIKRENGDSENHVFVKFEVTDIECGEDSCSELEENVQIKVENPVNNWTREEDKTILLILREDAEPEFKFNKIQELLPHRKLDEIKERFKNVLSLLQKLT